VARGASPLSGLLAIDLRAAGGRGAGVSLALERAIVTECTGAHTGRKPAAILRRL
jgi:hypothetical protein